MAPCPAKGATQGQRSQPEAAGPRRLAQNTAVLASRVTALGGPPRRPRRQGGRGDPRGVAFAIVWSPASGPRLQCTPALGLVRALRRHWRAVSLALGSLLVAFGVLFTTGELLRLTTRLARFAGRQI
jgi:hypothetical protein